MPFDGTTFRDLDPANYLDTDEIIQQLRLGRMRIERGWNQVQPKKNRKKRFVWWWNRRRREYCAITAVTADACPYVAHEAADLLCLALGVNTRSDVYAWNDAPGRTRAEVLFLYDRAIAHRITQLVGPSDGGGDV